ncbi:MAG: flagellar FliJ family protein [Phycisphaerales bacterium]|nr:flagellar FliJ family protein [Hyphomonadaceae bacterium]
MKALRTLLKLAGRDLEILRRALANQIARDSEIKQRIAGHEQTIISEQRLAQRDYESARAYGGYAVAAIQVRRALAGERVLINHEIERLRTLITEAHIETRKFERLIELEEAREKAKCEKRENAELDEFATMRFAKGVGE